MICGFLAAMRGLGKSVQPRLTSLHLLQTREKKNSRLTQNPQFEEETKLFVLACYGHDKLD